MAKRLVGSYALAVVSTRSPDHIVVAKNGGSPIIFGLGEGESFLGSDIPAILPHTRQMLFLADGEFAVLSRDGVQLVDANGHLIERAPRTIQWDPVSAEKGGFDHFMQKEIFEQPRALRDTLGTRLREEELDVDLDGIDLSPAAAKNIERVTLVACGTALLRVPGRQVSDRAARGHPLRGRSRERVSLPASPVVDRALPARARLAVGRDGRHAGGAARGQERAARACSRSATRAIRRSPARATTCSTRSPGPEIGVASTKCFTAQFLALYLLAIKLGIARKTLDAESLRRMFAELRSLPRMVEKTLALDGEIRAVAQKYFRAPNFLFLGRGIMYPIALEGALKLKEISYIHAEGYAAGEMKHGPIALIDQNMPVVVIANRSPVYDKMISNLEQVRARDGQVIAIASEGDGAIEEKADAVIRIPELGEHLTALLATIPVQLLAYHVAALKGTDVDQPRNLAKSVTVE